jgi:hypothetical protein
MGIKYVNVCLDKQDYLEKLFSNKNNKRSVRVSDIHYKTAKRLAILPIIRILEISSALQYTILLQVKEIISIQCQ